MISSDLSDFEFSGESLAIAVLIAGVILVDILFGTVLGTLLYGARRRDGKHHNPLARQAEEVYNRCVLGE